MKNILSTLAISALVSLGSNALMSNSASAAINFVMSESGNDIRMERSKHF
ncbi:MAG: hypothetical protein AAGJ08_02335 [Cyanobacteria bacterium P01_H01_bin.35]